MAYDDSDFIYLGGAASGNQLIGTNSFRAFLWKYQISTGYITNKAIFESSGSETFLYTNACDISGGMLTVGTENKFSVGVMDPSTMAPGKHYMLSSSGSSEALLPGLYYKSDRIFGSFFVSSKIHAFSIDTTDNSYVLKEVQTSVRQSYAITTINDYLFVPMFDNVEDPNIRDISFKFDDMSVGYQARFTGSGETYTLESAGIYEGSTKAAVSYCGAKNSDKKMWFHWSKWNTGSQILTNSPSASMQAEYTPDSGFDSSCMAVAISTSDVDEVYYAIGIAKSDPSSSWTFGILKGSFTGGSGTFTPVASDITGLTRNSHYNLEGGQMHNTPDQFFFVGSTKTTTSGSFSKQQGFLFSSSPTSVHTCSSSSPTSTSPSDSSISFSLGSAASSNSVTVNTDALGFSAFTNMITSAFNRNYVGSFCQETIIVLSPDSTMPDDWAYTVSSSSDLTLQFPTFSCSDTCGTISYRSHLKGEADFGVLQTVLSFDSATRTYTLAGVNNNSFQGTYTLVVHVEESQEPTTNTLNEITLVISPVSVVLSPPGIMPATWDYTVGDGAVDLTFDDYTCNIACGTISYSSNLSGIADFGALNTFLTFDTSLKKFTLDVTNNGLVNSYNIQVKSSETSENAQNNASIIVLNIYQGTIIVSDPGNIAADWQYTVGDGVDTFSFDPYICNIDCGTISYTAYIKGQADFQGLNSFLSFNSATRTFTLANSATNTQAGTYTIEIKASENEQNAFNNLITFDLVISELTNTFTAPVTFPTTNWMYSVDSGADSLQFDVFACGPSCGTIAYSAYIQGQADFDTLAAFLSFNTATRTFSLTNIDSNTYQGDYIIEIKVSESQDNEFDTSNTITLTIVPIPIVLIPPVVMPTTWSHTVGASASTLDFNVYTCTPSCGAISYTSYIEFGSDFGTLNPYLTFNPTTRQWQLSGVNSNSFATTYTLVVKATEAEETTIHDLQKITLTIVAETITLYPPGNMPTTMAYTVGGGVVNLNFDQYVCNIDCGTKSYSAYIKTQGDFAPLNAYVSFTSATRQLTITNLNTNTLANSYTIVIEGEEDEANTVNTAAEIVLTISPTTITLDPPGGMLTTWTYNVGSGGDTHTFNPYTCNIDCGTISYVAYIGTEGSFGALDGFLTLDSNTRTLTLDTSTANPQQGSYTIVIKASETEVPTVNQAQTITLSVNPVSIDLIPPVGIPTTWGFIVNQAVDTLSFQDFTCSSPCGVKSYDAYIGTEGTFGDLDGFLTFDGATKTFTLQNVVSNFYAKTYPITIKAMENQEPSVDTDETITLTIASFDPIVLVDPGLADQTIVNQAGLHTYTIPAFTHPTYTGSDITIQYVGSYTDDITFSDTVPSDGVTFDPATRTFTFDPTQRNGNTRTLKIRATPLTTTTTNTMLASTFIVNYIDVILNAPDLSAISNINYSVLEGPKPYSFRHYTSAQTIGALSYSAVLDGGAPLPACISFDQINREFTVNCPNNSEHATYTIRITATEALYSSQNSDETIQVIVTGQDVQRQLVPSALGQVEFEVGSDTTVTQSFADWTSTPYFGSMSLSYALYMSDGVSAAPSFITLTGKTLTVTGVLEANLGSYSLAIKATDATTTVTGSPMVGTSLQTFTLLVSLRSENQAPNWSQNFENQVLLEGERIIFLLPVVEDPDEDDTFTYSIETDGAFITLDEDLKTVFIEPQLGNSGTYSVTVTVTDSDSANSGEQLTDTATFEVTVNEQEVEEVQEQDEAQEEEELEVDWSAFEMPDMDPPQAEITKVSSYGEVIISFSQNMMVPANVTQIDGESIQFTVLTNNDLFDPETIILEWEIKQFNEDFMKVKLKFTDTMLVSSTSDLDSIELTFLETGLFISTESFKTIETGSSQLLLKQMPMQIEETKAMAALSAASEAIEDGSAGFALITLAIQLLLAGSLALLWGMVNTLQIIVHMPLMNISMPPNARTLSMALVSLAGFDFLPIDQINSMLFGIEAEPDAEERVNDAGFDSSNFLLNCAQMLFAFIFWFVLAGVHKVFKLLTRCIPRLSNLAMMLEHHIYYGVLIVLLLESYLEVLIAAFVQVKVLHWGSVGDYITSLSAIAFAVMFTIMPFTVYGLLQVSSTILYRNNMAQKMGELYKLFRVEKKGARMFNFFFLLRRLFYGAALVFGNEFVCFQLTTMNIGSFMIAQYILIHWPYKENYMNRLELFNESIILSLSYLLWSLSDYQGSVLLKLEIGWLYCGVIGICILVNFLVMIYFAVKNKLDERKKKKQEKKEKEQEKQKAEREKKREERQLSEKNMQKKALSTPQNYAPLNQTMTASPPLLPLKAKKSNRKAQAIQPVMRNDTAGELLKTQNDDVSSKLNLKRFDTTDKDPSLKDPQDKSELQNSVSNKSQSFHNSSQATLLLQKAQKEEKQPKSPRKLFKKRQIDRGSSQVFKKAQNSFVSPERQNELDVVERYLGSVSSVRKVERTSESKFKSHQRKKRPLGVEAVKKKQTDSLVGEAQSQNTKASAPKNSDGTPVPMNNVFAFFQRDKFKGRLKHTRTQEQL